MTRWALRLPDLIVVVVLTAGTQAEVWAGLVPGAGRPALATSYLVGTLVLAWPRLLPLASLAVSLSGLAVVPAVLGGDPNAALSSLAATRREVVAARSHARRPAAALSVAAGLLGITRVATHGLSAAHVLLPDPAFAWLLGAGAWVAGRALANRT